MSYNSPTLREALKGLTTDQIVEEGHANAESNGYPRTDSGHYPFMAGGLSSQLWHAQAEIRELHARLAEQ